MSIQPDTVSKHWISKDYESKVQTGDLLNVRVSSLSPDFDDKINKLSQEAAVGTSIPQGPVGYLVDSLGRINMHFIGTIEVKGLTLQQVKNNLEKEASQYLKQPLFSVSFLNRKVTLLGDVASPGIVRLEDGLPITLLDLLAMRGDVRESALLSDVMVIRDSTSKRVIHHLNLSNTSFFSDSFFYIRPNDVVIVKRDINSADQEKRNRNSQVTTSIIVSLVSVVLVILNTFFK